MLNTSRSGGGFGGGVGEWEKGGREGVESALALSRSMFAISLIEMVRSSEHISSFIMHTVNCRL